MKNFKIVAGQAINYKAGGNEAAEDWTWELGTYNGSFVPIPVLTTYLLPAKVKGSVDFKQTSDEKGSIPKNKPLSGECAYYLDEVTAFIGGIPVTVPWPLDNEHFGTHHGSIRVDNGQLSEPVIFPGLVSLFFEKDKELFYQNYINNQGQNVTELIPHWFYYWKQVPLIDNILTIPGIPLFDIDNCTWIPAEPVKLDIIYDATMLYSEDPDEVNSYGSCSFNVTAFEPEEIGGGWPSKCPNLYPVIHNKAIGYKARFMKITVGPGTSKGKGDLKGIHAFYSTVLHEVEHAIIRCEVWATGYDNKLDLDEDNYRDDWEDYINILHNLGPSTGYRFDTDPSTGEKDKYGNNAQGVEEKYDPRYLGQTPFAKYSAGTEYEEWRCRKKEADMKNSLSNIDHKDWSYDKKSNKYQGKQW